MNTTATAPAPPAFPMAVSSAGPSWQLPHFSASTAHIKQEPSDGEAVDRHDDSGISPGRSGSGSSGGPSPQREDPVPSQHHDYFQQPPQPSPSPSQHGHYLERLDTTPAQPLHSGYYYNNHQHQITQGQSLPHESYYNHQQQQLFQQQQQQPPPPEQSAHFQLGSPVREPVAQSPVLRTPPPSGSAQAKQEAASPPEGTPSPAHAPAAAGASAVSHADENSSSSSQSSTEGEGALRRLQAAVETMGMANGDGTTYECPVCTVRTQDKNEFQAHLGTHYEPRCPSCEHVAATVDKLHAHMREAHALSPPQDDPAEAKINSQGRVKTFRCKQCGYLAVTKLEFWTHSRVHIKAEKLLTCNRCPFVTEYKHHLEYHLRNHSGWKPFHCDKCDYQCVNKSMLNSHLKSHSNVYQYRCADCTYATKYCHSLKLHLRKYQHRPDVVLNPDGSPNPLPIIDVYGTRRGPKQRPRNAASAKKPASASARAVHSPAPPQPQAAVQPRQPPLPPPPVPRAATAPQGAAALPAFAPAAFGPLVRPGGVAFPYSSVGLAPSVPAFPYNPIPHNASDAARFDAYYAAAHSSGFPFFVNNNNDNESPQDAEAKMQDYMARFLVATHLQVPNLPLPQPSTPLPDPLDLTKPEPSSPAEAKSPIEAKSPVVARSPSPVPSTSTAAMALPSEDAPVPAPAPTAAPPTTKHRRKGKAYKLERVAMKLQYHEDDDSADDVEPSRKFLKVDLPGEPEPEAEPQPSTVRPDSSEAEDAEDSSESQRVFYCEHCEITFRDVVMYSLHKGYHGLNNPFTCNACGKETADRVEFFVHIARSPHS